MDSLRKDILIPHQLQSALTYIILSMTNEHCRNPTTVTSTVTRIQVTNDHSTYG